MDKMKKFRLQELDGSNYEIVKGEPDIRGWDVRYFTGQKLGTVEDLLIDPQQKIVRYMIVDMDENELKLINRKILIPIGLAELDRQVDDVLIPNITIEQLSRLPDYDKNNLTANVERRISSTLGREIYSTTTPIAGEKIAKENFDQVEYDELDPEFYKHEHYNPDNLYKNRMHEPERLRNESEYDRGLHLWERRSDGGLLEISDLTDEERREIAKRRRNSYRERRYKKENI